MTLVREYQPTFVLGDGETKEFSYLFEEVSENFIKVIVKHSDDSTYVPVFSVDLDSHKVVFGESETAPLDTDLVCIYRETPDLQDTPFRTLQGYDAKALENILSKIVAMIQELKANGFSTQILQGTPWQLDLLHPADDGASVVVDYNARILKKGLYFQIVSGNLQVSADGNSFITMPKSADITEFRRLETILEDLTVIYRLQYKVDGVWYNAESNAEATADEALQVAQVAKDIAEDTAETVGTFDTRITQAEQNASDAKSIAQTTSGNLTTHTSDMNNPHQVTKAQVGLGNVDNTSDLNKPISTATQAALDTKANTTDIPTVGNGTITITQGGTTKGTFTTNQGGNTTIDLDAGGSGLPGQTGNAGKFLTTDGTDASWSDKPLVNTATGSDSLTISGSPNSNSYSTNIGVGSVADYNGVSIGYNSGKNTSSSVNISESVFIGMGAQAFRNSSDCRYSVGIGQGAEIKDAKGGISIGWGSGVYNDRGIGIGFNARALALQSIQIGSIDNNNPAFNNDANTFKVANANGNFEIMSADGTIPESRLADTTSATQGQVLTLDSNLDAVWADASSGGSGLNVGDTFMTMRTDNELNGAVECDGATYNTTDFTGTESIGELLEAGKLDYVSLSAYSTAISTKGWCDKIGWDGTGNTQFRVPTLNAHIVQTNNIPVVGNGMTIGLTNGTNNAGLATTSTVGSGGVISRAELYGATVGSSNLGSYNLGETSTGLTTDGTKSGIIADTSDTAQLRVMIQLATGATDQALETCTGVLADVAALKYDYVVDFQAPTAQNNYTWYRKYKSGWVEQGGETTGGVNSVILPIEMADTHYTVIRTQIGSSQQSQYPAWVAGFDTRTTTGFTFPSVTQNNIWQVSGMSAS